MSPTLHRPSDSNSQSRPQSAKSPTNRPKWLDIAPVGLVVLAAAVGLSLQLAGGDTTGAPAPPVAGNLTPQPAETSLPDRPNAPSALLPPNLRESGAPTEGPSFEQWLSGIHRVAEDRGISPRTLDLALTNLQPIDGVLKLDTRQSEYQKTFFEYLQGTVSGARIQRGRVLLQRHQALLDELERKYGVSAPVLIALWGMESDFGAVTGSTPVIATVATLAYGGRRRERFLEELLAALAIINEGHASPAQMRGSWAGAMGQPQFLPSTYLQHGRDGDGDGWVDIWGSTADTLTSAAYYLFNRGWRPGEPWIREAWLPAGFDHYQARLDTQRSLSDWGHLGVRDSDGQPLPDSEIKASILLPAGHQGPAILVFENFRIITDWNRSLHYALAVGHLANRIAGAGPLRAGPPPGDKALPRGTIEAMQRQLSVLGFGAGEPDGMIGRQTRAAVRDYQQATGHIADAYPTAELARAVARDAGVEPAPAPGQVVADIQRYLNALGHDAGAVDGIVGSRTSDAIRAYQRSVGLPETGQPSNGLLRQLSADAGG